jgi:hypothetical protein
MRSLSHLAPSFVHTKFSFVVNNLIYYCFYS